jgi:dephospho-CoA kinase
VARLLEERGLPVLDVDTLGHQAIEVEKAAVIARFGASVLGSGGVVDRKALGQRVFGKPPELAALEAIVHPAANRLTEAWIAARQERACVINAALLHRSSVFSRLDCVIVVNASTPVRLFRAWKRDRLPLGALIRRFASQKEFHTQYSSRKTDMYTVYNNGCSVFRTRRQRRMLEERINTILSREGL